MNNPPIIGFDAKRAFRNATGLGNYGRTLINALNTFPIEMRLYAPNYGNCHLCRQIKRSQNIHVRYPKESMLGKLYQAYWRSRGIVSDLKRDGVDIYHGLSGELPIGLQKSGIKGLVTIHDLIFMRHPEYYHWIDTKLYAWKFRQTMREAKHIIAISECTKRDILYYAPEVDPARISVIYQSCAPRFTTTPELRQAEAEPRERRYILSVGSIEARKNTMLAVKALPYLPDDLTLTLVGKHTPYTDELLAYAEANGLAHRVKVMHGVSDEQLPALYAGAEAFVYPSRYEGFGIPIIEAINCGLPVVACTGSCLEEAGGPDSLYVDPDDAEAMANAIRQVLRGAEGREQRITASQSYIRRFQGQDVAGQVYELYQQLLEQR